MAMEKRITMRRTTFEITISAEASDALCLELDDKLDDLMDEVEAEARKAVAKLGNGLKLTVQE